MKFSADLRLSISEKEKNKRIDELIKDLAL